MGVTGYTRRAAGVTVEYVFLLCALCEGPGWSPLGDEAPRFTCSHAAHAPLGSAWPGQSIQRHRHRHDRVQLSLVPGRWASEAEAPSLPDPSPACFPRGPRAGPLSQAQRLRVSKQRFKTAREPEETGDLSDCTGFLDAG